MAEAARATADNPVFGIEKRGIDFIPEEQRTMTLRSLGQFWVWCGLGPYS